MNVKAFCLGALVVIMGAVVQATAQESNQQTLSLTTSGWQTSCNAVNRKAAVECRVEANAVLTESGQRLTDFTIRVPEAKAQPLLMVRVPLEVSLSVGITMKVDEGKLFSYSLQTCNTSGCYFGNPLDKDLLAAMIKGKQLIMTMQDTSQNDISLTLPLNGFAEAFTLVK